MLLKLNLETNLYNRSEDMSSGYRVREASYLLPTDSLQLVWNHNCRSRTQPTRDITHDNYHYLIKGDDQCE